MTSTQSDKEIAIIHALYGDKDGAFSVDMNKVKRIAHLIAEETNTARIDTIDKIFEFSPTTQFKDWKPQDAMLFYQRLKAYETTLKANKGKS